MNASPRATAPDCLLCRKHRGEYAVPGGAIYADALIYAGHAHLPDDTSGQYLGWVTIETRRHVPGWGDLNDAEAAAVGRLAAHLSRALLAVTGAEHVYSFVIGHGFPHFHLHLIPRYPGTPREYWGARVDEWPEAPRGDAGRIADLCERLRVRLAEEAPWNS
jgi:diadenosine tetraphosphate (Ap4A) HIT family hydrolase